MTNQDLKEFKAAVKRLREEHPLTPELARETLIRQGVIDEDGNLTGPYARTGKEAQREDS